MQARLQAHRRARQGQRGKKLLFLAGQLNEALEGYLGSGSRLTEEQSDGVSAWVSEADEPVFAARGDRAVAGSKEDGVLRMPPGRERPSWAKDNKPNCRGRVDPGPRHYLALITINGAPVEGIVDTGAFRTMMDIATARTLGIELEERDPDDHPRKAPFGRFFGPDCAPHPYEGRTLERVVF